MDYGSSEAPLVSKKVIRIRKKRQRERYNLRVEDGERVTLLLRDTLRQLKVNTRHGKARQTKGIPS